MRSTRVGLLVALLSASPALAQPKAPAAAPAPASPPADPAGQPTAEDLAKAKEHFAKGKQLFDAKDFAKAVEEFKESYRLSKNPLLLYNVGFTLDQLDQRALALFYYQKFVAAVPADNPNVAPAKDRIAVLQKAIEDASLGGAAPTGAPAAPAAGTPAAGAEQAAPPTQFDHKVVDAAPPGKPVDIGAFVPAADQQATLFFRAAGEAGFTSVPMQPRYNERVGRIPAGKTTIAPTVQYYIEVRDAAGQITERSGKSTSPNLIFVEKDALPHYYADLGDDKSYHDDSHAVAAPVQVGASREPTEPGDGWFDAKSSKLGMLKWGTTWTAVGALALSGTFYLIASNAATDLENEADASESDACPDGPPCRAFSGKQQDLEGRGRRFETLGNVGLIVGGVAAVSAGVFWYLDARDRRSGDASASAGPVDDSPSLSAAPVLAPDYVGGAALFRF